jgi:hypothetical protein
VVQVATYLGNAFSISMLSLAGKVVAAKKVVVEFKRADTEEVRALLSNGFISAIGHPATASALSKILGVNVPTNRVAITLQPGDTLIVFQLNLGRLVPGQELGEQDILRAFWQGNAFFVVAQVQ